MHSARYEIGAFSFTVHWVYLKPQLAHSDDGIFFVLLSRFKCGRLGGKCLPTIEMLLLLLHVDGGRLRKHRGTLRYVVV